MRGEGAEKDVGEQHRDVPMIVAMLGNTFLPSLPRLVVTP
jgi:hypothetical protein